MKIGIMQLQVGVIGGNDTVLVQLIKILKSCGHDIILFTFSKPSKESFPGVEIKSKTPIHFLLFGLYKNWFLPKFDYSDCDIVLSTTGLDVQCNCPLIIYDQNNLGREFDTPYIPIKYRKGFWKYYYLPYKKFNKKETNTDAKYVANSIYSASILENAIKKKVSVLYPYVDISKYKVAEKKDQIVMFCRISPEKNLEFAVNVLNQQSRAVIMIGGVSTRNSLYFNKIKKMAKSHITVLPNVSRAKVIQTLAESKVLFSSALETFGITVVESIASGCIPIVPNNSAHPETVPINELRYTPNDVSTAVSKLCNAMSGNYDYRIDALRKNIKKFDLPVFENGIKDLLK